MMKTKNILSIVAGIMLSTASLTYGQIYNGDFSIPGNGITEVADGWIVNTNTNRYRIVNSKSTSSGALVLTSGSIYTITGNSGDYLFVDGLSSNPHPSGVGLVTIFRQENISVPSGATTISMEAASRFTSTSEVEVWLNTTHLGDLVLNSHSFKTFTFPLAGQVSGPNNILYFKQKTFTVGGNNDWAIDNIKIDCYYLTTPQFTINGSNENQLLICDEDNISIDISPNPYASHYFLSIRNLNTNVEHMRYLTSSERATIDFFDFDLSEFARNPAFSELYPSVESESMDLEPGVCYQVKVAMQASCTPWVEKSQIICIERDCNANSTISIGEPCNPLYLYANSLTPGQFIWDFGDGHTSNFQNPIHQYDQPGTYIVTLVEYERTECDACCNASTFEVTIDCGNFSSPASTWSDDGLMKTKQEDKPSLNTLEPEEKQIYLKVFPNPVKEQANISFELKEEALINVKVYNSSGTLVSTVMENTTVPAGTNTYTINTGSLPTGLYHIALSTSSERKSTSFVVSK